MTEWEPATEAEIAMRDALRANDQEQYFRILARTDILLPISPDAPPRGDAGWGTWTTDGRTHVLAFTSPSALHECLAGHPGTHRRVLFRDLVTIWPNVDWWLAVNPGLPIESYLPSWFVTQISRGDVRLPGRTLGARARIEQATSSRTRAVAQVPLRSVPNQPAPTPIERQRMRADQAGQAARAAQTGSAPGRAGPEGPTGAFGPRRDVPPPDVAPPGAFLPTRADRPLNFERTTGAGRSATPPSSGFPASAPPSSGYPASAPPGSGFPASAPPGSGFPASAPTSPGSGFPASGTPQSAPVSPPSADVPRSVSPARGRATFPSTPREAPRRGLFDEVDRQSLDVPGERDLFTDLPARPSSQGLSNGGGAFDSGSGLPSRTAGEPPANPPRFAGSTGPSADLPRRPFDEAGGDPRRNWPRRDPGRSLGEVYTEHADPVIPAAWQPPPTLPGPAGPPLPTRQPQTSRPETDTPFGSGDGGALPSRPGRVESLFGKGEALPSRPTSGESSYEQGSGLSSWSAAASVDQDAPTRAEEFGQSKSSWSSGDTAQGFFSGGSAEPGGESVTGSGESPSGGGSRVEGGSLFGGGSRAGGGSLFGGGSRVEGESLFGGGSQAGDSWSTSAGRTAETDWAESVASRSAEPASPEFDPSEFGRVDGGRAEAAEPSSPFGSVSAGARSAGFGRSGDLDEHPFFTDTPDIQPIEPRVEETSRTQAERPAEGRTFESVFDSPKRFFETPSEPDQATSFESRPTSAFDVPAERPAFESSFQASSERPAPSYEASSDWSTLSYEPSASSERAALSFETSVERAAFETRSSFEPPERSDSSFEELAERPSFETRSSFEGSSERSASSFEESTERPSFGTWSSFEASFATSTERASDDRSTEHQPERLFESLFGTHTESSASSLTDGPIEPVEYPSQPTESGFQASFASGVDSLADTGERPQAESSTDFRSGSFFGDVDSTASTNSSSETHEPSPELRSFFETGAAERASLGLSAEAEAEPVVQETGYSWTYTPETVYEPEIVDEAPVRLHEEIVDAEVVVPAPRSPAYDEPAEREWSSARLDSTRDFQPANTVERDLFEAVQANSTDRFLSTLLLAKVLIPFWTGDGPIDPTNWRTEHMNGLPHLVVFTSDERMTERIGPDARGSWIKFTRLIRHWPPGDQLAFAINPESPAGAVLPGAEVVQLATWATELGLGVDDPDEAPPAPSRIEVSAPRPVFEPPVSSGQLVMQKPISPEQLSYYLERNYDRVSGFVHRAGEVAHLQTPDQLYNALGLGYAGSSFKPDADESYVLRWIAYRGDLYRIPYGGSSPEAMRAMEGWVIERPPFRGNGFAPSETSDVIAEFKVDSARLPHDAELWRLRRDGRQELIARLDADGPTWRKTGAL